MYYYFFLICKIKLYQIYWVSYIWTHILCFSRGSTAPTNPLFPQLVYWVLFLLNFSEAGLISSLFCTILSFCTKLLLSTKSVQNISHLIKKNLSLGSSSLASSAHFSTPFFARTPNLFLFSSLPILCLNLLLEPTCLTLPQHSWTHYSQIFSCFSFM